MAVFPLTSEGESCALSSSSKNQSHSLDSFNSACFWLYGFWKGECGKEVAKPQLLLLAAVLKTHPLHTPQKVQRRKLSLSMFHFFVQVFFLSYKNLFSCLIKESQNVIVKTSSGKCNSLTRNYMSYLSPLKLLLQEVHTGEMYCIGACASDVCQRYFPVALQQFPCLHKS